MGMIGNYLRVSEEELKEFLNDSSKLDERVFNESDEADPNLIDIDKAWDGIFYLLTGKTLDTYSEATLPLLWISFPPNEIDPDLDMGYGPACYTTPEQTKELSAVLNTITIEEFKSRYNGKLMMELDIYPQVWENEEGLDYLVEYFTELKTFYKTAVENNQAVIVFIN
jgi:Domain of unknown function (DUF1877)